MPAMATRGLADLHLHTCFSDGWPTPTDLVEYVRESSRLNVIAITDHDTIEGALRAADLASHLKDAPDVIVGEEVSSRDGHIVGLFLERRVRPGMSAAATVHAIHDQGGIAMAAHPFWRTARQVNGRGRVHGVGWLAAELDFDAIEVENSTPGFYLFNQMAHRLTEASGVAQVGNSDAHILDAVGRAYTSFSGRTAADLRDSIASRRTRAHRRRYRALGLVRYAAWGLNHQRVEKLVAAAR
jgi:predicted metal-dependent phosphoesterase TrpH